MVKVEAKEEAEVSSIQATKFRCISRAKERKADLIHQAKGMVERPTQETGQGQL